MSERHPIIAITGSSGAGTSTVTRTFAGIFAREGVKSAVIEGDSFHRYDRKEMKARQAEAEAQGDRHFSHFGVDNNLIGELENLFAIYAKTGQGKARKYLHNAEEAAPYKQEPGTFTEWEALPSDTDVLFYEGLHGAVVTDESTSQTSRSADRRGAVINLEWIQKLYPRQERARLQQRSRGFGTGI
jgi:phosphoribulokinase